MACVFFWTFLSGSARDLASGRIGNRRAGRVALARRRIEPAVMAGRSVAAYRAHTALRHRREHSRPAGGRWPRHDGHRRRDGLARHHVPLSRQPHTAVGTAAAAGPANVHHRLCLCRPSGVRRAAPGGAAGGNRVGSFRLLVSGFRLCRRRGHPVHARSLPIRLPGSVVSWGMARGGPFGASPCRWHALPSQPA